jgi:DNA polymerase/3'-5' exonuclease PolX
MIHAGDVVRIKGQHHTSVSMRVVKVEGNVATLRYLGGSLEFNEYISKLDLIKCRH